MPATNQKATMSSHRSVPDYYEILQVHPKASLAVIKKAYRALMLDLGQHPDQGGNAHTASLITEAYQVLSSEDRRAAYDAQYFKQTKVPQPPQATPPQPPGARPQPPPSGPSQSPPTPAPARTPTGAIVICPRCQTKNRVRNTQKLDQARCHKCSQTLKGGSATVTEGTVARLQAQIDALIEGLEDRFPTLKRYGEQRENPKVGWVWGVAIPIVLMVISGALIAYVLNDNNFMADNPIEQVEKLQQAQNYPQAEALLSEAIAKDSANPRLHEKLGDVLVKQHSLERAIQEYDKAIILGPDNAWVYALKGQTCLQLGRSSEAEAAFKKALDLDRTQSSALEALGQIRLRSGRFNEAVDYLKRAADANPGADNFVNLGTAYQATRRHRDAEVALLQGLSLDQGHLLGLKHLADVYLAQKQFSRAVPPLKKACERYPTDGELFAKLGACYAQQGDRTNARDAWSRCLALSPDNPSRQQLAKEALAALDKGPAKANTGTGAKRPATGPTTGR